MSFRLHIPDVRLLIAEDALPGGLEAWGEGRLEVVVDGSISLGEFFDITERMAMSATPGDDNAIENLTAVRDTMRDFGERIKQWSIEGLTPGADGFMALPYPLALAIFTAWQKAATPDPTSSGVSANGASSPAVPEMTAA